GPGAGPFVQGRYRAGLDSRPFDSPDSSQGAPRPIGGYGGSTCFRPRHRRVLLPFCPGQRSWITLSQERHAVGLPRRKTIPLSLPRRFMCDLMHASRRVPLVAVERHLRLGDLCAARQEIHPRPSWFALFVKAWALVAERRDELRRSYLSFPWPRLHQHACNVANLAVARRIHSEGGVLALQIRQP